MSIALKLLSDFVLYLISGYFHTAWHLILFYFFLPAIRDGSYCQMTTLKGNYTCKSLIILGRSANHCAILSVACCPPGWNGTGLCHRRWKPRHLFYPHAHGVSYTRGSYTQSWWLSPGEKRVFTFSLPCIFRDGRTQEAVTLSAEAVCGVLTFWAHESLMNWKRGRSSPIFAQETSICIAHTFLSVNPMERGVDRQASSRGMEKWNLKNIYALLIFYKEKREG